MKLFKRMATTAITGSTVGASAYATIGGLGIAGMGTAIGITLVPFMLIGAGAGAGIYGVFLLGKHSKN